MRNLYVLGFAMTLLAGAACSSSDETNDDVMGNVMSSQAGAGAGDDTIAGHAGSAGNAAAGASGADTRTQPEESETCTLTMNESTASDVKAVFGQPSSESRANGPLMLSYAFEDGSSWIFGFDEQGVWNNISVTGATEFPSCWVPDGGWFERPDGGWVQRPDGGWWQR